MAFQSRMSLKYGSKSLHSFWATLYICISKIYASALKVDNEWYSSINLCTSDILHECNLRCKVANAAWTQFIENYKTWKWFTWRLNTKATNVDMLSCFELIGLLDPCAMISLRHTIQYVWPSATLNIHFIN